MPEIEANGETIQLNEEGFMLNPEEWNEDIALALAKSQEGIDSLTAEHWSAIRYIREYYEEKKMAPMVRKVCKNSGLSLTRIFELFPSGPAKGACKLAGLPKPDGCV
jgi:tRNA 2-thiouridine synthesizing protein E